MTDATDPRSIVERFLAAMAVEDYSEGLALIAQDCVYINGPSEPVQGPEGVRATLEPFFAPIDENIFLQQRVAVAGNTVFVERLDRHRIGEAWIELPVTGVFEVNNGKISYWREYFDLDTIREPLTALLTS